MDGIKIKNFHSMNPSTTGEKYLQISGEFVELLVDTGLYQKRKNEQQKLGEISEIVYLLLSAGF